VRKVTEGILIKTEGAREAGKVGKEIMLRKLTNPNPSFMRYVGQRA